MGGFVQYLHEIIIVRSLLAKHAISKLPSLTSKHILQLQNIDLPPETSIYHFRRNHYPVGHTPFQIRQTLASNPSHSPSQMSRFAQRQMCSEGEPCRLHKRSFWLPTQK